MKQMKSVHRWLILSLAVMATVVLMLPNITRAGSARIDNLALDFDVMIGSSRMFTLDYSATLDGNTYAASTRLNPKGIAKLFANYQMAMAAKGEIRDGRLVPATSNTRAGKSGKVKSANVAWENGAVASTERSDDLAADRAAAIDATLVPGLADPLTALLRAGSADAAKPCAVTERVYSGMEVYDLAFSYVKRARFDASTPGNYRGPAVECRVDYRPVAGLSDSKMAKLKRKPVSFRVWFAPVHVATLGRTMLVPVAVAGEIKNRQFMAVTDHATLSGRSLSEIALASQ